MDKMNIEPEARNTYRCQATCIKPPKARNRKQQGKKNNLKDRK
jgi:hypothetical protein